MDEPLEYIKDGEELYGVYENDDGSTYTKFIGIFEDDEDFDGCYVDVSGDFGGAG